MLETHSDILESEKIIPLEKLQNGFDICAKQMDKLLIASEILIQNKLFSMSIPLSILAREELSKLGTIQDYISGQKPIPKPKWNKLTGYGSHQEKLLSVINRKKELSKTTTPEQWAKIQQLAKKFGFDPIETSYQDMTTINPTVKTNLESLNIIKQECWYLGFDWEKNDWRIITKEFTKNQLEAVARTHLVGLKFLYYYHNFLNYKTQIFISKNNKLEEKMLDSQKKYLEEKTKLLSPKFRKLNTIAKSVLIDYGKRKEKR